MSIKSQLLSKFGSDVGTPEILEKCEELISLFGLSPEDLFLKWESFVYNSSTASEGDLPLNLDNLQLLQEIVQKQLAKQNQRTPMSSHVKKQVIRTTPNMSMSHMLPSTPLSSNKKRKLEVPSSRHSAANSSPLYHSSPITSQATPSGSSKSAESGKLLETLNVHIPQSIPDTQPKPKLLANFNPQKYKFRTLNQKLLEVADYLDDQIDTAAKIILDHYKFEVNEFGNPCIVSQNEILAVGRIVPDSSTTDIDTTLNSNSLYLEPSRSGGIGKRVSLDISALDNYSFFPGQIVCFRGINFDGSFFKVSQQYEIPFLGAPVSSSEDIETYKDILGNQNLKVVVTCGPYTSTNDLDFGPLSNFVDKMNNEVRPNNIVMFGPFLDINHPSIAQGKLNFPDLEKQPKTLDDVFKFVIAPILNRLNCQVILIPSTKDANSKHAAYPQDSLDRKTLGLSKNIKCFPNPATFQVSEVFFGCSNNDIYRDLKDVNSHSRSIQARFDRIATHVLEQRRYYPSFPGGLKKRQKLPLDGEIADDSADDHVSGADLHVSYMGLSEFSETLPDVLIIPSELKHFAKIIKNVVIINPGTFMKMHSNGSYAIIDVKALDINDLDKVEGNDDLYLHNVWKRARVDIVRT